MSTPGASDPAAADPPRDDLAPEPIPAPPDGAEAIPAGLEVLWEVAVGDTPMAVTFDPAAPPC